MKKDKLILLVCVVTFGAFLDWLLGLQTNERSRRDWPHLHKSAQINEPAVLKLYAESNRGGSITAAEIANGHPPVKWPDGMYKLK